MPINFRLLDSAATGSDRAYDATGSSTGGGKSWDAAIAAGATIVGGLINSRGSRRANQMTREDARNEMDATWRMNRENQRANMQTRQDDYQREIMRNRAAISPYRQMYQGPRFQFAEGQGPDAPIYNPLMESGHMFQQLGQDPTLLSDRPKPPKPPKPRKK